MSRVKVISESGDQLKIMPSYGLAMKLAAKSGWYSWGRWLSIIFILGAGLFIWLNETNRVVIPGSAGNYVLFALIAIGMGIFFGKPSQVMTNNEIWVAKVDYDRAVAEGTEELLFTRTWA